MTSTGADQVNGGGGVDTIKLYAKSGTAATQVLPTLSSVEKIWLVNSPANLDVSSLAGVTDLIVETPDTGLSYTLKGSTQTATVKNVTTATTVNLKYGTSDTTANIILDTAGKTGNVLTLDVNAGAAVTTANITTTVGASNVLLANAGAALKTINITGDKALTLDANAVLTIKTINASTATGNMTVTAPTTSDLAFTGGSGDDVIKFAAGKFNTLDVVNGGTGKDTLSLADTGAPSTDLLKAINAATNFETLAFSGGGATIDAALITNGVTSYSVETTAGNFVLTNNTSAGTVTYTALNNAASTDSIANKLGDLTANVALIANSTSQSTTGAETLTGINTLNLSSTFTGTGVQATANAFGTTDAGNADNTKFVVTGTQDLIIAPLKGTTTGSTVDASAFTGKLTATGSAVADSLTGGSAADKLAGGDITGQTDGVKEVDAITVTLAAAADTFNVVVGGVTQAVTATATTAGTAGAIVTALTGNATIAALVSVAVDAGNTSKVNITWLTAGAKTDVTIGAFSAATTAGTAAEVTAGVNASAGTGTAAADVLTGNAGADTFIFKGLQDSAYVSTAATVDKITDFTAGSDKIDISAIAHDVTASLTAATPVYNYTSGSLVAQATVQASVNAASPSTLAAAVTAAATQIVADKVGVFQYGGDTYVFLNDHTATVATTDGLIKLTGAVTLAATDFVFHA